jgi:hypothetical protein
MPLLPIIVALHASLAGAEAPLALGPQKELFLDDHFIASMTNVTRRVQPVVKHPANPVLEPDQPWEETLALLYGSVLREDDGRYRMWYYVRPGVAYAESDDGITWTKPALGLYTVEGRDTNLIHMREDTERFPHFYELFGVLKDPGDPDPQRRYKMAFLGIDRDYQGPNVDPFHGTQRRGLGLAGSPDGIHFTLIDNWATEAICDGATHIIRDPARDKFVVYGRTKHKPPEVLEAWKDDEWATKYYWGRAVARVESDDLLNWDYEQPATAPVVMASDVDDPPGTGIYGMGVFPYEGVYIGLVQRFINRPDECILDIQLAVSRDGIEFTRVSDRSPFIPCGPVGSWDRYNNSVANNPPIVVGDEIRFYYAGRTYRHGPYDGPDKGEPGGRIGLGTVQRDRFCALEASFDGGVLVTKPLTLAGAQLHLNADARFGEVTIQAHDSDGNLLATAQPVQQDGLDIPVQWTDTAPNPNTPLTLTLTLRNAKLFALWTE